MKRQPVLSVLLVVLISALGCSPSNGLRAGDGGPPGDGGAVLPDAGPSMACGTALKDAASTVAETMPARPALDTAATDPDFGACFRRITDSQELASEAPVPEYSQLQAWNADGNLMLLADGRVLETGTYSVVHRLDYGWPAFGNTKRWAGPDPLAIVYTGGIDPGGADPDAIACAANQARLMRYRLVPGSPMTARRELIRCFPEYIRFDKNASYEEVSLDGKLIGLVGVRADGGTEAFLYDMVGDVKHRPLTLPKGLEWVAPSPRGTYAVINWGGGGDARYSSVEAYSLDMEYLGKLATGHGHGDLAVDANGVEWYVDISPDNYVGVTGPLLKKHRLPDGYDRWKADPSSDGIVSLLRTAWSVSGGHVSCQTPEVGWCVISLVAPAEGPWVPFAGEIFKLFLDSTEAHPHVERLMHHRSRTAWVSTNCETQSSYWTQPHATSDRKGHRIAFGSSWGDVCRADAYVIDVSP